MSQTQPRPVSELMGADPRTITDEEFEAIHKELMEARVQWASTEQTAKAKGVSPRGQKGPKTPRKPGEKLDLDSLDLGL